MGLEDTEGTGPRRLSPHGGAHPAVPWAIELRGGVSGLRADLHDLEVSEIAISGGASDVALDLPQPSSELALRVAGGLSNGTVARPASVPVTVEIDGGAADLRLDDDHLGAVVGGVRQRTQGHADTSGEIAIRIDGGASGLSVIALNG